MNMKQAGSTVTTTGTPMGSGTPLKKRGGDRMLDLNRLRVDLKQWLTGHDINYPTVLKKDQTLRIISVADMAILMEPISEAMKDKDIDGTGKALLDAFVEAHQAMWVEREAAARIV